MHDSKLDASQTSELWVRLCRSAAVRGGTVQNAACRLVCGRTARTAPAAAGEPTAPNAGSFSLTPSLEAFIGLCWALLGSHRALFGTEPEVSTTNAKRETRTTAETAGRQCSVVSVERRQRQQDMNTAWQTCTIESVHPSWVRSTSVHSISVYPVSAHSTSVHPVSVHPTSLDPPQSTFPASRIRRRGPLVTPAAPRAALALIGAL